MQLRVRTERQRQPKSEPLRAITVTVRLSGTFLEETWEPLLATLPEKNVTDLLKEAIRLRAVLESVNEANEPFKAVVKENGMEVDLKEWLGF